MSENNIPTFDPSKFSGPDALLLAASTHERLLGFALTNQVISWMDTTVVELTQSPTVSDEARTAVVSTAEYIPVVMNKATWDQRYSVNVTPRFKDKTATLAIFSTTFSTGGGGGYEYHATHLMLLYTGGSQTTVHVGTEAERYSPRIWRDEVAGSMVSFCVWHSRHTELADRERKLRRIAASQIARQLPPMKAFFDIVKPLGLPKASTLNTIMANMMEYGPKLGFEDAIIAPFLEDNDWKGESFASPDTTALNSLQLPNPEL